MGFLRFSKRNIGGICYAYESELRLVFAESVTLLRFAFFRVVLEPSFLLSARKIVPRGPGVITLSSFRPGGRHPEKEVLLSDTE